MSNYFSSSPPRFDDIDYSEHLVYRWDNSDDTGAFELSNHIYSKGFKRRGLKHYDVEQCLKNGVEEPEVAYGKATSLVYDPDLWDKRTILIVGFDKSQIVGDGKGKCVTIFEDDKLGSVNGSWVNKDALKKISDL